MPTAALRPCATCGLVGCQVHVKPAWHHARPVARVRGRALQRRRARLLSEQPLCVLCLRKTPRVIAEATIRDHIRPLAEGGPDTDANTQAICGPCHAAKTADEAARGQRRHAGP